MEVRCWVGGAIDKGRDFADTDNSTCEVASSEGQTLDDCLFPWIVTIELYRVITVDSLVLRFWVANSTAKLIFSIRIYDVAYDRGLCTSNPLPRLEAS